MSSPPPAPPAGGGHGETLETLKKLEKEQRAKWAKRFKEEMRVAKWIEEIKTKPREEWTKNERMAMALEEMQEAKRHT
jgi:hypothetical protein